jgi:DinB family protein
MNRRQVICGMVATTIAAPLTLQADEVTTWTAWWERSKKYTLAIAEAMPPADYNFAPFGRGAGDGVRSGDGARTFGEVMQHIGQAEGFYLGRFGKGTVPAPPQNDTTKTATVKYLNEVFDWAIGVVRQLTSADLNNPVSGGRGPAMTGLDLLLNAMVHTAHTRGYSDMYLRNKGVKPPTYQV